jgi:hypothetical protein
MRAEGKPVRWPPEHSSQLTQMRLAKKYYTTDALRHNCGRTASWQFESLADEYEFF